MIIKLQTGVAHPSPFQLFRSIVLKVPASSYVSKEDPNRLENPFHNEVKDERSSLKTEHKTRLTCQLWHCTVLSQ
jgi:hypothetical protein